MLCKKSVLRNLAKFTGKHLCQGLFFNKVAGLRCFPVNFVKLLRTPFLTEHLWWLLLKTKGNKIKGNLCFLCSTILINEIEVLQNSQFYLIFLKVITLFLIANILNNRVRVIHVKIKFCFVAN